MSQPAVSIVGGSQALRFLATGGLNTAVGFAVVLVLLWAGVPDIQANLAGYIAGLILSFFINRSWTFSQKSRPTLREAALFASVFCVAYGVNLLIVVAGQQLGFSGNPLLHLCAVAAYSVIGFVLAKRIIYTPEFENTLSLPMISTAMIAGCTVAALLIIPGMPITHDVVWQLWIARQMNNGVQLYTQINEVNPPLWFWMAMPVDALATKLGTSAVATMQTTMILLCAVSTLLVDRLLPTMPRNHRLFFLFNAFALGLLVALGNFAQREQIAMVASLPYCLLIVRRVQGENVSTRFSLFVGLLAASGFALKPFFVAAPLLLELWLLFVHRRGYRPFRPETLVLAACAILYAVAVFIFAPDFIALQLPMVVTAYGGYSMPFIALLVGQAQIIWIFCIIAFLFNGWFGRDARTPLSTGLLITTIGFLFSFAAQKKGWVYHSLPVTYFVLLALTASALQNWGRGIDRVRYVVAILALAIGYWFPISSGVYQSRYADGTNAAMAGTRAGSTVYILSSDAQQSWPMVVEGGYRWPSRFMSLWMLPAIGAGLGDQAKLSKLSDQVLAMTVEDLQCNPPDTFLIARTTINLTLRPLNFNFREYFTKNVQAAQLLSQYDLVRTDRRFYIYRRKADASIPLPAYCREIY